jgi:2-polyprenyl-3-methyl-5-hydroxy-6-metoxy-1,4-benzoquinol methylase
MRSQSEAHWNTVYQTKAPNAVSWYLPHLQTSLDIIRRVAPKYPNIIDVGGGESTLPEDLLAEGYRYITILDISQKAIDVCKKRMGGLSTYIKWLVDDVTKVELPANEYDIWHDRAVFHFLTREEDRRAYVERVAHATKPGGHVIVATFGPEGPTKCSGLDVVRYNADALHDEFGKQFTLLNSHTENHSTPWGATQQFLYCLCKVG